MQDQSQDQVQFDLGIALGPALGPATMCINANGRGNGWLKTIWLIYKLAKLCYCCCIDASRCYIDVNSSKIIELCYPRTFTIRQAGPKMRQQPDPDYGP